jgi:hypothetical protein
MALKMVLYYQRVIRKVGTSSSDELISSSSSIITLPCDSLSLVSALLFAPLSLLLVSLYHPHYWVLYRLTYFCLISLSLGSLSVWSDDDDYDAVNAVNT